MSAKPPLLRPQTSASAETCLRASGSRPAGLSLTPRKIRILQLVALGLSNDEIAARFGKSNANIKSALTIIKNALKAKNRLSAVLAASEKGLLYGPDTDRGIIIETLTTLPRQNIEEILAHAKACLPQGAVAACLPTPAPLQERQGGKPASIRLTDKCTKILWKIAGGQLDKEIAYDLGVAVCTVKSHLGIGLRILKAKNRIEAVLSARRHGYLPPVDVKASGLLAAVGALPTSDLLKVIAACQVELEKTRAMEASVPFSLRPRAAARGSSPAATSVPG